MPNAAYHQKVINPGLANAAFRSAHPHGEFKVFIRLAKPEKRPEYMQSAETYEAGVFKARVRCDEIERMAADNNIISIELREHIASGN